MDGLKSATSKRIENKYKQDFKYKTIEMGTWITAFIYVLNKPVKL